MSTAKQNGRFFCSIVFLNICAATASISSPSDGWAAEPKARGVNVNELRPIENPRPLLADCPEFIEPIRETARFEAPPLVAEKDADLAVRAWRFFYNARGIIEMPNRLRADRTAVIVVHPWGIDDGQGWKSPQSAGVAFFCTPEKNRIYHRHVRQVVNPFLKSMRGNVALIMNSLPGGEDPIRRKLYRSFRQKTTAQARRKGQVELEQKLKSFSYRGQPVIQKIPLSAEQPVGDYFRQFPGLDAGANFNNAGFWDLLNPVVRDIQVGLNDVVIYDLEGYDALKTFLQKQGIRHVLLAGYATDMCVCSTTAGYENLRKDFNVFLVGVATLATFPAMSTPKSATTASIAKASFQLPITQVSWVRPLKAKEVAGAE